MSESEEGRRACLGGDGGSGPCRGPRRSGGRLRQAGRARKRGRGGPRWAGVRRAAGAAEEAGAGLPSPGSTYCSALMRLFAGRALLEGGVLRSNSSPTPTSPNSNPRVGSTQQVLASDTASEGFLTPEQIERTLYNVRLNWRKLGKPATHIKEEGKQRRYAYKVITR